MGRGWVVVLFIVYGISYSQDIKEEWEVKSDSAYLLIKNGKADEALPIINSIDKVIKAKTINRGIPYVNFLYRKAITYFVLENPKSLNVFKKTLIALKNDYDQQVDIKTNSFLGDFYFNNNNDELAFKHYSQSIDIESNIEINENLEHGLYKILFLESQHIELKSEKYRKHFIELKKYQGDTINLKYAFAFKLYNHEKEYLEVIQQILARNKEQNLIADNIEVYEDLMFYYSNKKDYQLSVKSGNKMYETAIESSSLSDYFLSQYCAVMSYSFRQLGDDLSEKKLSSICHKVKDEDDPDDFFSVLEHHINNREFEKFEAQFKTFENILKTNINKNGYADNLLSIYSLSISLYEIGELFSEFDIERQLTFIDKHESNLNKENIEVKKIAKAEFYFFSNQFEKLEKICISYNRTDNNELNLTIYSLHAMSDYRTKPENPRGLSLFLREIDECDCIDKPQYLRHYIVLVSGLLNETETYKWANRALFLMDKYNLNYTEQGIYLRIEIAKQYASNNSVSDALTIYKDIYNYLSVKNHLSNQETAMIQVLYGMGEIYLASNELDSAKIYLNELESIKGITSATLASIRENYKYSLKMRYLFRSKEYLNHKEVFGSLNLKDKYYQNILKELETDNYVLSKYFLDKNIDETIESLNDLLSQKPSLRRAQLLFEFQLTKNPNKPNTKILINALHEEYKLFNAKAYFLNRSEFVKKISEMQFIIDDISNFLPYLSSEDLSSLIELKNYINIWKTNRSKRQIENEEFLKLDEKINNYRRRIEQELEKFSQNNLLIDSLKFKVNNFERIISSNLKKSNTLGFEKVDHYFSKNDVYIEYIQTNGFYNDITNKYWGEPSLMAVVLSKSKAPKVIKLGKIDKDIIDNLKETYNSNIQLQNPDRQDDYVWNYMIQPLFETLSAFDNIYIKNNGVLGYINLEAINIPGTLDLMIDRFNVNRMDALFKMNNNLFNFKELKSIGIYGNPDFEKQNIKKDRINNNRSATSKIDDIKLSYLTGAKEEIKLIEKKAADFGISSKLYDFTKASESNFKADNDYDVIHIATHAYDLNSLDLDESNNTLNIFGLDKSQVKNNYFGFKNKGLFFAGSQNTIDRNEFSGYMDNGILNGNEITNMEFNGVNLVVLSACNTIDSTGKGFTDSGLDSAFLIAGAQEVLATLWDIDDLKTREFMGLFYENYFSNRSTALEALNKTKEQFRILNPEPYYWAPFVIVR